MKFTKMHGLGNDFMVINCLDENFSMPKEQIGKLSNRNEGVGFDQLLIIEQATDKSVADFKYRIFNADGSEVEHCGNGARCFAKYLIDKNLTDKNKIKVEVKKGIIEINYISDKEITVDMGLPILEPAKIPFLSIDNSYQTSYELNINDSVVNASVVSMGNPHVIIFVNQIDDFDIAPLSEYLQNSPLFPESVNVNFAKILDDKTIQLRTYERGVGETRACGTGACATMYAAYKLGISKNNVCVQMKGGNLDIKVEAERIFMTGEAVSIYDAEILE